MSWVGPPGVGFEILLGIDSLMAKLSFERFRGMGFEILLRLDWLMARLNLKALLE